MVNAARTRFPDISFQQLVDTPHLDIDEATVDATLLFAVLTCVPSDDGQRSILGEISRVLRPGGLIYISDLWLQNDRRNLERYERGHATHGTYGVFDLPEGVTMRHHDRRWIESLTNGYDVLAVDEIVVQTMNGNSASGFQRFGRKKRTRGRSVMFQRAKHQKTQ
jgi:SAM-dependent methyltransferase